MKEFPITKAFMWIEPGPVTLVTTAVGRKKNIMTISWTLVMDFTPKLAFVTGPWNHSFHALIETKECVIAIPSADMSEIGIRNPRTPSAPTTHRRRNSTATVAAG